MSAPWRDLRQGDAILFGRVTYEMTEGAWRVPRRTAAKFDGTEPFVRTIVTAKKDVASNTLVWVTGNAELVHGELRQAVEELQREPLRGWFVGGVRRPQSLTELGLIDE